MSDYAILVFVLFAYIKSPANVRQFQKQAMTAKRKKVIVTLAVKGDAHTCSVAGLLKHYLSKIAFDAVNTRVESPVGLSVVCES